jgi:RNA polymerase sigma-70 factor (ECF subfamily)
VSTAPQAESALDPLVPAEPVARVDALTTPELSPALRRELFTAAEAANVGLSEPAFAAILERIAAKHNAGEPPAAFLRTLHLADLALAHACALGLDPAWQRFLHLYRARLTQAAIAITRSVSLGQELADSLYAELYGLTERDGLRRSPLASYSGRGSLMGWLRTTLAHRHVDHHRRTHREDPLEPEHDIAAPAAEPAPDLAPIQQALAATLRALPAEDAFLLSAYFLDGRTLLELSRLERVHEATISRRLKRLTAVLHQQLLKRLESAGMSRRAAQEQLGVDPRDLDLNLRTLLQASPTRPFSERGERTTTKAS